jgi:hypothetical protein
VDFAELTCNLSIADCNKEVAENRVRLRMNVGAIVVPLQRLKSINRVLLCHRVLDLRFWRTLGNSTGPPCDLTPNCKSRGTGYVIEQTLFTTVFPRSTDISKPEIGTSDFRIIDESSGGPATNDMTGFHHVTSTGN